MIGVYVDNPGGIRDGIELRLNRFELVFQFFDPFLLSRGLYRIEGLLDALDLGRQVSANRFARC